jgi:hypothetical protein
MNAPENPHRAISLEELKAQAWALIDAQQWSEVWRPLSGMWLNPDQLERAKWLGLSEERIQSIDQRAVEAKRIIGLLETATPTIQYLTILVGEFYNVQGKNPVRFPDDLNDDIEKLIWEIFTSEVISSDIAYSTPFYGSDGTIDDYNIKLWLLYSWRALWRDHPCYWKLFHATDNPAVTTPKEYLKVWRGFTYNTGDDAIRSPYYEFPLADKETGDIKTWVIQEGEVWIDALPKVFSTTPLIIQKPSKKLDPILQSYVEEIYVLSGATDKIIIPVKVLRPFIEKNLKYFRDNPSHYRWKNGRDILQNLINASWATLEVKADDWRRKKKSKKWNSQWGANLGPTATSIWWTDYSIMSPPWQEPHLAKTETKTEKHYPQPTIYWWFESILMWGANLQKPIETIAKNLPQESIFWIWSWTPTQWTPYRRWETVTIEAPSSRERYTFCYTEDNPDLIAPPEDTKKYPRTEITITPRLTQTPSSPPWSNIQTWVLDAVRVVLWNTDTIKEVSQPVVQDKALEVWVEIIEILEWNRSRIIIIWDDPSSENIIGIFATTPSISFTIRWGVVTLWPNDAEWINMADLHTALESEFPKLITISQILRDDLFLSKHSIPKTRMSTMLRPLIATFEQENNSTTEGEIDVKKMLIESRINDRYGWDMMMNRLHTWKFQALQSILAREWFHIELISDSWGQYKNCSLKLSVGKTNMSYTISFQKDAPYYVIAQTGSKCSERVDTFLRGFALDIYLSLSLIGKGLFNSQNTTSSKVGHRWYSISQIESIIRGTYIPPKRDASDLTPEQKKLIAHAAERIKKGELKISKWPSTQFTGVIVANIRTTRSIKEFYELDDTDEIILSDERFLCINDGQASSREKAWNTKYGVHPYSSAYTILRSDKRSQKYMIRRMIATLTRSTYLGLSPLINDMGWFLQLFWERISENKKREFLSAITGNWGSAGKGLTIKLEDSKWLFESFIKAADIAKIPLTYNKPNTVTKAEMLSYIKEKDFAKWGKELEKYDVDIGTLMWK